jgi:hypothetical protein
MQENELMALVNELQKKKYIAVTDDKVSYKLPQQASTI